MNKSFQQRADWARRLKREVITLWFALKHPDCPWPARALAAVLTAYAFSPIDLIPDFIPVLGYLDDLILLPIGIWLILRLLPAPVLADCRRDAGEWLANATGKPRSIFGVVIVLGVWTLALWALVIYL